MATRHTLDDEHYRGGALEDHSPKARRYPCFAAGCPMPGTIWPGATQGGSDSPGTCVWHYGVQPNDIPKVTKALQDWGCVTREVDECRRAHTAADSAFSPKALDALFEGATVRLRAAVQSGGWGDEFEPREGEHYRDWGQRLEEFLGQRVVEVLNVRQPQRTA